MHIPWHGNYHFTHCVVSVEQLFCWVGVCFEWIWVGYLLTNTCLGIWNLKPYEITWHSAWGCKACWTLGSKGPRLGSQGVLNEHSTFYPLFPMSSWANESKSSAALFLVTSTLQDCLRIKWIYRWNCTWESLNFLSYLVRFTFMEPYNVPESMWRIKSRKINITWFGFLGLGNQLIRTQEWYINQNRQYKIIKKLHGEGVLTWS